MRLLTATAVLFVICGATFAQSKKLNYQQAQLLKDAKYYLNQCEGLLDAIDEVLGPMKAGDSSVQIGDVRKVLNTLERIKQYFANVENRFKQLPANHPDVKEQADRYSTFRQRAAEQEAKATQIMKGLEEVVGQGQTEQWKTDFERLREINAMFGDPQIIYTNPERAIEIIKQIPAVKAERARIAEKYAALLHQETGESRDMKGVLNYFDRQFGEFDRYCREFAADAPAEIRRDIAKANQLSETAIADNRPAYFSPEGGINQSLSQAQVKLDLLLAYLPDSPEAAACNSELAEARARIAQQAASLRETIIANNHVPEQSYSGPDRDAMVEMVLAKWKEANLPNEVLKAGINSNQWTRDTRWVWSSGYKAWEKYDKSRLQGFVVVRKDDTVAVIHYVNFLKDHLSNDKIAAYWFDDPKDEPSYSHLLLISNVK